MRQRLGIAAALLRDPKLLLLDEPATGLDPAGMRDMRLLIRRLADQGMTVLLSSHLLNEVEDVCNRVAIVRSGRIVYEGEIAALKRGAGTLVPPRDDRRRARAGRLPRPARDRPTSAPTSTAGSRSPPTRPAAAELSQALVEAGALIRALAPQTVTLEDLFFSFTEGDGRLTAPRAADRRRRARATPAQAAALMPGIADRLPLGAVQAPPPEAHLPRARRGGHRADPVRAGDPLPPPTARGGDFAFSSYLDRSGLAVPLVILLFGAVWMFPLITALVAGDIFASEDHNGTLKTIFTRSLERWQIFAGKALAAATYAIVAILLCGTVAVIAGSIQSGFNSLQSLSGTIVSAPKALELVYVSLLVYLIPIAAIVCIGLLLSTVTRNSAAAVVGTLMVSLLIQLIGILPGLGGLQPYLLSTQFNAWQGLLRTPIDWAPIIQAVWVCALYAVPGARRRVPGLHAPRRRRWLTPTLASSASGCWSSTTTRRCAGCSRAR